MSLSEILYTVLLSPLQLLFEIIYSIAYKTIGDPGLSIIVLSLAMNFLVLPLYRRADAMQEEERNIEAKLQKGVQHIKKTFRGDEQMLMLQTYYRQNNYKPTYVLRRATSLMLEIPFFIAAYRFLSNLALLNGVSFGPIADLGKPDGLIVIAGVSVNVLPVIMTLVNFISSYIFSKGYPRKTKIQLYGMAVFFLIFLYTSPSGLVFYWTLNNLFSLVKTIFYKLKNPAGILHVMAAAAGVCFLVLFAVRTPHRMLFLLSGAALVCPLLFSIVPIPKTLLVFDRYKQNSLVFWSSNLFLTVLTGLLIPSAVIASSPQEFLIRSTNYHPNWYVIHAVLLAAGIFIVWMGVFYGLASGKTKKIYEAAAAALACVFTAGYLIYSQNLGTINTELQFDGNDLSATSAVKLNNLVVLLLITAIVVMLLVKKTKIVSNLILIAACAMLVMSVLNMVQIRQSIDKVNTNTETPTLTFSKSGKNVVVIMLDRGMGEFIPYLMNEKPELKQQFDGFTYYDNVISYGWTTYYASPALYGGYEYTPQENNKRDQETLCSKQNEALKVMPVLFDENGYDVTVCDPTYANYQWIPDVSIYDDYPDIKAYVTKGLFTDPDYAAVTKDRTGRNLFVHSLLRCVPIMMRKLIYDDGNYHYLVTTYNQNLQEYGQTAESNYKASGVGQGFSDAYYVLTHMVSMTNIEEDDCNHFLMMSNDTTHDITMLQEPAYEPASAVDNTEYEENNADRFVLDGQILNIDTQEKYETYQCNMAALLQLGKWFDYLRDNDVYDNTKIILVSDHGYRSNALDALEIEKDSLSLDAEQFFPILMVKDFDAEGFTTDSEFMTNADVPSLAAKDLIENPRNPITGVEINQSEKKEGKQYIIGGYDSELSTANTYPPCDWYSVHDNIWNADNWEAAGTNTTLPEE